MIHVALGASFVLGQSRPPPTLWPRSWFELQIYGGLAPCPENELMRINIMAQFMGHRSQSGQKPGYRQRDMTETDGWLE